jgi:toxin CptA
MSIAVSAVLLPSRVLRLMVGAVCAGVGMSGGVIACAFTAELPLLVRVLIAALSAFAAVFGFYHGSGRRKPIHIDISGVGQFRLTELALNDTCKQLDRPHLNEHVEVFRLLEHSTLWPHLLLLRLQGESGKITTLPILPDCVSQEGFRALSVACRWIAARGELQGWEES